MVIRRVRKRGRSPSRSVTSPGSRPKKACTFSPTRIAGCGRARGLGASRFVAAGYLAPEHRGYFDGIMRDLKAWGIDSQFEYRGEVDRTQKIEFLRSLDVFSVPATYEEPKGLFLLEAMASGVPVVQPRRGAFPEVVEKTGGGIIVDADNPEALADGFLELWRDPARATAVGLAGAAGVRKHYSVDRMAETRA